MLKFLPSQFFLSRKSEHDFQCQLNHTSRKLVSIVFYILLVILISLTCISFLTEQFSESITINTIRGIMIVLAIMVIYQCKRNDAEHLEKRFFRYAILFCSLNSYLFWTFANIHGYLNEGGPMLAVTCLVAVPMLHLGHKLILWFIIGTSLFAIETLTDISIYWTVYYFITIVIVMSGIQYQLDLLLRTQYQAELIEAEKAKTDQLTGVYNRHSFYIEFNELLNNLTENQSLAIAMIDIDHFKKYNDNYGHLQGDRVLVIVAEMLNNLGANVVVRFGGEEFILIKVFDGLVNEWLEDLPSQFSAKNIEHKYAPLGRITVSTGVVITQSNKNIPSTKSLLTKVDSVMYAAKHSGRNTTHNVTLS